MISKLSEKEIKVRITFTESILGGAPSDKEIYASYIASKAPDAGTVTDEIEALGEDEVMDRKTTIFHKDENGNPLLWDYQVRGFFKGSCGFLQRAGKRKHPFLSSKLKAYKKIIDGTVYVFPRQIMLNVPDGQTPEEAIEINQRPLRAQTAQGERVALTSSEELPPGTWCEITIALLDASMEPVVMEWLDFGTLNGIGQWRNGSHGRFDYEIIDEEE